LGRIKFDRTKKKELLKIKKDRGDVKVEKFSTKMNSSVFLQPILLRACSNEPKFCLNFANFDLNFDNDFPYEKKKLKIKHI
jgi:hypothetical protein